MAKWMIIAGIFLLAAGLVLYFYPRAFSWFGNLPGDIRIENESTRFYLPMTSMLLISIAGTLILNLPRIIRFLR